jgi:hypothetical protein
MNLTAIKARWANDQRKKKERQLKTRSRRIAEVKALPEVPRVFLNTNYVNPITLNFPKGIIVYQIKNRSTGRTNYYDKQTFWKLMKMLKNDYDLLMRNPKVPIPGARNPVTRGPIYPRNVRRVTVATKKKTPSPNTAANKIKTAIRKHVSKKKRVSK